MIFDLSSLTKALLSFERTLNVASLGEKDQASLLNPDQKEAIRAGVIQNFEFTYELCWKFMKRWLEHNLGSAYIDGVSRKELFRFAAESHLIENVADWIIYHDARNETVHTYDETIAEDVFEIAKRFFTDAKKLLQNLENKND